MVAEFCKYVIIGHSERRAYFGETNQTVNRKVKAALTHALLPIFCVGETLVENEAGITQEIVTRQVQEGLDGIGSASIASIVIAYEPVWAIGTGRAATAEDANHVIADIIRNLLSQMYGENLSQDVRILYGGSVKASNAREFLQQDDIDGALVGGASLKPSEFISIVKAAAG
jgi:triosephosphate isomerase